MFGAVNQTLAGLALIIIAAYLKIKGGLKWLVAGVPAVAMMVLTIWALVLNQTAFGAKHNLLLQAVNGISLILAIWIFIEGLIKIATVKADLNH
jgi:carbon starvation protein